jgi:hypothetical protein
VRIFFRTNIAYENKNPGPRASTISAFWGPLKILSLTRLRRLLIAAGLEGNSLLREIHALRWRANRKYQSGTGTDRTLTGLANKEV